MDVSGRVKARNLNVQDAGRTQEVEKMLKIVYDKDQLKKGFKMLLDGKSYIDIAKKLGKTKGNIYDTFYPHKSYLEKHGVI